MWRVLVLLLASGCVIMGGGGISGRDVQGVKRVADIGIQSAFVFPYHVGPLLGLSYRDMDEGGGTILQGGVRVEKFRSSIVAPGGPHGRVAARHRFDGDDSAWGVTAAVGYHWDLFEIELEYARESAGNDIVALFGIDIYMILAAASGGGMR